MADPKLLRYLRVNVAKYGAAPVREKLLEEGVSAAEIDEALAALEAPPRPRPQRTTFLGVALLALGSAGWFLLQPSRPPSTLAPAASPAAAPAAAAAAPSGSKGAYMGRYGYVLQLPAGYSTQTEFKDLGNKTEVVYLFPANADPTNFGNEALYGALGIMRLEVSPLGLPPGARGVEAVRAGITRTLTGRGDTFSLRDVSIGGMPGFIVQIKQPLALTQAFLLGTKVLYVLTGGSEDQKLRDVLNSLTEVSPTEHPAFAPRS